MVLLATQKDFQNIQKMPFCYVCGKDFVKGDSQNKDHVPEKAVFKSSDRIQVLWLPTHIACNAGHKVRDEKMGQLIGLRRGEVPKSKNRVLKFKMLGPGQGAIENLDVRGTIWSWVRGFHAALYRQSLPENWDKYSIEAPLPSGAITASGLRIDPVLPQHRAFVDVIKTQRAKQNLDKIQSNNKKLIYECVWYQCDNSGPWVCVFALDIYNWKDLGRIPGQPARGCAGFYMLPSGLPPEGATVAKVTPIIVPNIDVLDAFSP